jgi:methylated-DNA-[protein]-cysteine S-methyltransferase
MLEHDIKSGRVTKAMSFNQKVWAMCARIPKGQVSTYGEIARALGTKAYRAVGNALNRNPYAPQVPCHRVVGSDGSLTGFGGGLKLKAKLLGAEGIAVVHGKVDIRRPFKLDG